MTAEPDLIGFNNHLLDAIASDWNINLLAADLFVPGPPTFDDAALFQDIFGLALPPPTREGCPIFLGGMLPDASPGQAIERNAYLLPPVPEVSIIPQAVIMPTSNITRDYHPSYQRATGAELVLTGGFRSPVAVPTVALPSPFSSFAATFPANWMKIGQRSYNYGRRQLDFKPLEPIPFSTKEHPGFNLGDALRKNYAHLNRGGDSVPQGTPGVISCRLLFLGYPDNGSSCQIHTLNWARTRSPIPLWRLAHEVARKVNRYLIHMARITPDGSVEDHWRIGQGFMHIDNMYLVSLTSVSKGSFQPEIYVEVPAAPRARTDQLNSSAPSRVLGLSER